jgi:hypothetical protein
MVYADVCAVPVQLTTLVSSAALSFSPGTSHYHALTSATKAIISGSAIAVMSCNVTFIGGSQSFADCAQFKAVVDVPNNVTISVYVALDDPHPASFYSFQIDSKTSADHLRVLVLVASGEYEMDDLFSHLS